jgi:selenocysteine lyase/cysteine desulfurase
MAFVAGWLILRDWDIQPGDEVLMPAYNCGTEVDPVLWCGAKVVLYRVDHQANADWRDVQQRVTNRTRVLYITYYFGWSQHLGEVMNFCQRQGIRIIEDCALSLFSTGPEGPSGVIGDAAVFSFPKTLAVPDGGALTMREGMLKARPVLQTLPCTEVLWNTLPLVKRAVVRRVEIAGLYGLVGSAIAKSWATEGKTERRASRYAAELLFRRSDSEPGAFHVVLETANAI